MSKLSRIILHWTAGGWVPNATDLQHYHFVVAGDSTVRLGRFKPEDNLSTADGSYAAHCGGGNTGAIGIAFAGMKDFNSQTKKSPYQIKKAQFEKGMFLTAQLCLKYNISVTEDTVMTHMEFGQKNPKTSSAGKIDICFLDCYNYVKPEDIGDFIRGKVRYYIKEIKENSKHDAK